MNPTRRSIIKSTLLTVAAPALGAVGIAPLAGIARAQPQAAPKPDATDATWRHGLSLFGDPKYPAGFKQFEYVNPNAPKGGLVRLSQEGTFDSLNFAITKGTVAAGIGLIYDTLMISALDEIATEYGLLAEAVRHPADWSSVTYRLRREAKWHDGHPVTPEDVVWTFGVLKQHNPNQAFYYRHVVKADVTGERDVTFTFDSPETASCRRSSASSTCCRNIGGPARMHPESRATSLPPRSKRPSAAAPTRSKASWRDAPSPMAAWRTMGRTTFR